MKEKNERFIQIKKGEKGISMLGVAIVVIILVIIMIIFLKSGIDKVFSGTQKRVDEINRGINNEPQEVYDNTLKQLEINQ